VYNIYTHIAVGYSTEHNVCNKMQVKRLDIPFSALIWHCWLGDRKGIRPVKSWVLVCWWWWFDWSFARFMAPVITTTSVILCFNKHRLTHIHLENGRLNGERERGREKKVIGQHHYLLLIICANNIVQQCRYCDTLSWCVSVCEYVYNFSTIKWKPLIRMTWNLTQ